MGQTFLTSQEEMILITVGVLQPDAYAYSIRKEIASETGIHLSLATIHTILYRMADQKFLESSLGGSTEKRGGRSKRLYKLTNKGLDTIKEVQSARSSLWLKFTAEP